MKKYNILFLLSILMNVLVVSAQNISTSNSTMTITSMDRIPYNPFYEKQFLNGEALALSWGGNVDGLQNVSFYDGIYFSKDKIFDISDLKVSETFTSSNSNSYAYSGVYKYTIPCNNPYEGKVYIILKLDDNNLVSESNENDNTLIDSITIKNIQDCGVRIFSINTYYVGSDGKVLKPYTNTSYSSIDGNIITNSSISGDFQLNNYKIKPINLNTSQFNYYLSSDENLDIYNNNAFKLVNPNSTNTNISVAASGNVLLDFNKLYYPTYPNPIKNGYYYLYIIVNATQYNFSNSYDKGTNGIGKGPLLKIGTFKDNDLRIDLPQNLTLNTPYSVNLSQYQKGRETRYGSTPTCFTSKSDQNTVDFFVKFKATASIMSLTLSADDVSLESAVELTTSPKTCINNVQSGAKLRYYTFDNLTVGNFYTARVEYGGNAPIGYARTDASSATSVTLSEGGITTGIESNTNNNVVSIYPNPSNDGKFSISSNQIISKIKVSNALGESEIFANSNEFKTSLKGLLFVEVTDENGNSSINKVVVE